jgi:putative phosphoesterase
MRLLGLIGDTQGRYRLDALMAQVHEHFAGVDEIWHAGDWQDPRVLDELRALGKPLHVVNGNAPDDPAFPDHVVNQVGELTIGMVHRPPVPSTDWVRGCDIVIHGHTHRWRDEVVDGVRFINVSTPTAAGFSQDRTLGRLRIDGRQADLERVVLPKS